jgi:hypothetical protein
MRLMQLGEGRPGKSMLDIDDNYVIGVSFRYPKESLKFYFLGWQQQAGKWRQAIKQWSYLRLFTLV